MVSPRNGKTVAPEALAKITAPIKRHPAAQSRRAVRRKLRAKLIRSGGALSKRSLSDATQCTCFSRRCGVTHAPSTLARDAARSSQRTSIRLHRVSLVTAAAPFSAARGSNFDKHICSQHQSLAMALVTLTGTAKPLNTSSVAAASCRHLDNISAPPQSAALGALDLEMPGRSSLTSGSDNSRGEVSTNSPSSNSAFFDASVCA
ncbi:hypothetical protein HPB50_014502 [Hyalomma asiaticum]|uniref:Uncharacterized protein n=1 Tax=Hyalomma asiaticum TaxID=266040 RepID=A0ACB7SI18_HYAAI|nr:hypothetical protein HPB50_014502 [Hyalomma asiaticum]